MTKREIADLISTDLGVPQAIAKKVIQRTLDSITEALVTEGRIELRNFGVFEVTKRAARIARNPHTGEKVIVPDRMAVKFTAGKAMEERVAGPKETVLVEAGQTFAD